MTVDSLRKDARVDLSVTKLMEAETAAIPGPSDLEAKDFYTRTPTASSRTNRSAPATS